MTTRVFYVSMLGCAALIAACGSGQQPEANGVDLSPPDLLKVASAGGSTTSANTKGIFPVGGKVSTAQGIAGELGYYGGPIIPNAKIVQVNWNGNIDPTIKNGMAGFYSAFTQSELFRWLDTDYATTLNANLGSHNGQPGTNQHIGLGTFSKAVTLAQIQTSVTDSLIQLVLAGNFTTGVLPAPDANTIYMIQFPPHTTITDAFNEQSCSIFCAYHSTMTYLGQAVKYGVLPDMSVDCNTGCGTDSSYFNNGTMVASHELIEAVTDPNVGLETTLPNSYDYPGAWAGSGGEIGDLCGLIPGTIRARQPNGTRYVVQKEFDNHNGECIVAPPPGDEDLNGDSDIALTGGTGWGSVPVAFSNGDGTFRVTNIAASSFATFAAQAGAKPVAGDFDGDGRADIALTGGTGWSTVPVAFANGDGTFRVTNSSVSNFPTFATQAGAKAVAGDFNGDGKWDIALTGGTGWGSVPVAFSNGDGTFRVTNIAASSFATFAAQTGAKPVAGDFNGDGYGDIALTGGTSWNTVPVAFSNGDGSFNVSNQVVPKFPTFATQAGATPVAGDFDGDGLGDVALTGGTGWGSVPVAFSMGNGTFRVTNIALSDFPIFAAQAGAKPVAGDFDGDGRSDVALTGGTGWGSVPVAFSNGDGTFRVTNQPVSTFATFAAQANALPVGAY